MARFEERMGMIGIKDVKPNTTWKEVVQKDLHNDCAVVL